MRFKISIGRELATETSNSRPLVFPCHLVNVLAMQCFRRHYLGWNQASAGRQTICYWPVKEDKKSRSKSLTDLSPSRALSTSEARPSNTNCSQGAAAIVIVLPVMNSHEHT
jgi:hypothetical protein